MSAPLFRLGDRVFDRHTCIEGTVYKIETCLYREPRYEILRDGVDSDGALWPDLWLFEGRLHKVVRP